MRFTTLKLKQDEYSSPEINPAFLLLRFWVFLLVLPHDDCRIVMRVLQMQIFFQFLKGQISFISKSQFSVLVLLFPLLFCKFSCESCFAFHFLSLSFSHLLLNSPAFLLLISPLISVFKFVFPSLFVSLSVLLCSWFAHWWFSGFSYFFFFFSFLFFLSFASLLLVPFWILNFGWQL